MDIKLYINNNGKIYDATDLCEGEIILESQRRGSPAKLSFKIYRYGDIDYQEGNEVILKSGNKNVFKGYVFKKNRTKQQIIETTVYDQIIYLRKNKDTIVYTEKTAADIIGMLANDYKFKLGPISATPYVIPSRSEDIQTILDIIYNALDLTVINTGKLFVLYDDAGNLTLKSLEEMKLDKLVSADNTLIDYNYSTDIDSETFNKIKLVRDNQTTGTREAFVAEDSANMKKWGILTLHEKVDDNMTDAQIIELANRKLGIHNRVKRTFSVEDLAGDFNIRAGNSILVDIPNIGDISIKQWLVAEKCTHTVKNNEHRMKLELTGL